MAGLKLTKEEQALLKEMVQPAIKPLSEQTLMNDYVFSMVVWEPKRIRPLLEYILGKKNSADLQGGDVGMDRFENNDCANHQTDGRQNYLVWRFYYGKKKADSVNTFPGVSIQQQL